MERIRLLLLFIMTIFYFHGFSQADYRQGYYITLENDTVYGLIDYRGEIRNSKICVFKKDVFANEIKFEPKDIKAYRYKDSKYYISRVIKTKQDGEIVLFLEYLVNGMADLFYYSDMNNDHYFIETKDGKIVELTNEEQEVYVEGIGEAIRNTNKHIGILKATFADCQEIQSEIDKTKLTRESLILTVKDYHDYVCDGEKCIIYEKKLPKVKVDYVPFIGINLSDLSIIYDDFYSKYNLSSSISPSIGLILKISLPMLNEKLSLNIGAELSKNYNYAFTKILDNYSTVSSSYFLHMKTNLLELTFPITYTYPNGKIRPTLGLGPAIKYIIKNDSKLVEERKNNSVIETFENRDIPISKAIWGGQVHFGCEFNITRKLVMYSQLKYCFTHSISNDAITKIQSLNLSLGIYL